MSKFFDDTMQGLLEAVAIDQKQIAVREVSGLPATTFRACRCIRFFCQMREMGLPDASWGLSWSAFW